MHLPVQRFAYQFRVLAGKFGDRDRASRTEREARLSCVRLDANLAVPTEGMGPHVYGAHEGPAPSYKGSPGIDTHFAVFQDRDIGRGPPISETTALPRPER